MRAFTRMVSVWSPSLLYAQSFAPTFIAMLLMFGGFLVPRVRPHRHESSAWAGGRLTLVVVNGRRQIHIYGWWIWMYWANPVSYAFQGLASNEFWGREYSCTASELVPPTSDASLNVAFPEG